VLSLSKSEIEQKIAELKMDYIRIQGDIEKLESVGQDPSKAEQMLENIEKELSELRKRLEE
jgi:ABC-type Zn uptake system ZnuABC Zn-binding protein ZnuA